MTLALAAFVLAAYARPLPALAADGSSHKPSELWKTFPLGPATQPPEQAAGNSATRAAPQTDLKRRAAPATRRASPSGGRGTRLWDVTVLILALAGATAGALVVHERRSAPARSREPPPGGRPGRLAALAMQIRVPERLRALHPRARGRSLDTPDSGAPAASPEDPFRASTTLRVLARLHDAGVLDDEQFAARQAKVRHADSLRALAELHDIGVLDDEQFAAKRAELLDAAARGG